MPISGGYAKTSLNALTLDKYNEKISDNEILSFLRSPGVKCSNCKCRNITFEKVIPIPGFPEHKALVVSLEVSFDMSLEVFREIIHFLFVKDICKWTEAFKVRIEQYLNDFVFEDIMAPTFNLHVKELYNQLPDEDKLLLEISL